MSDHERTIDVFRELLETLPESERNPWFDRWLAAQAVETDRRRDDEEWTRSLYGVQRFGQ